ADCACDRMPVAPRLMLLAAAPAAFPPSAPAIMSITNLMMTSIGCVSLASSLSGGNMCFMCFEHLLALSARLCPEAVHPGEVGRPRKSLPPLAEPGLAAQPTPRGGCLGKIGSAYVRHHRVPFLGRQRRPRRPPLNEAVEPSVAVLTIQSRGSQITISM